MNLTRKEREREFRRKEILSAAAKIFAEKGFTHATLDEIAGASEFGKGTLYNYFQSKEELYAAILENIFEQFIRKLQEIEEISSDLKSYFTHIIEYMLDFCTINRSEFTLMAHKRIGSIHDEPPSLNERLRSLTQKSHVIQIGKIKKSIEAGEIRDIDPEKLLILTRGMVFSYAQFQIACRKAETLNKKEEVEFILSIIFNGIIKK